MGDMFNKYFEWFWREAKNNRKKRIINLLDLNPGARLLDCGCDDGSFTLILADKINTNKKYGIEIDETAINKARQNNIIVKKSDLNYKFPFANSFFDVIVADQVIEHLWDLDNFASEIRRTLKHKGYVIISTENLASWHNIGALILGLQPFTGPTISKYQVLGFHPLTPNIKSMSNKYSHTPDMPPHTKVLTLTGLISLFRLYKFQIEQIQVSGYFPFPPFLEQLLNKIDKKHSFFITIKVRKLRF